MKKDQKTIITSFLVIIFLGIIIIFFGFYNKNQNKENETKTEEIIEVTQEDSVKVKEKFSFTEEPVVNSSIGNGYSFDIKYPKTNIDFVNNEIGQFIENEKNEIRTILKEDSGNSDADYTLNIDYKKTNGKDYYSVIFSVDNYTGGAHGNFYYKTFSYNQDGKKVLITDFIKTDTNEFSQFLIQKVLKILPADFLEQGGYDWVNQGITKDPVTFSNFAFEEKGIRFFFDPYQIGPWSLGPQQILIDYSELENFLQL